MKPLGMQSPKYHAINILKTFRKKSRKVLYYSHVATRITVGQSNFVQHLALGRTSA
jgi:hypothetical protein